MDHTKELWEADYADKMEPFEYEIRSVEDGALLAEFRHKVDRDLAVECVNACAGIENPGEAIEKAKEALSRAEHVLNNGPLCDIETCSHGDETCALWVVRSALSALGKGE